MANFKDLMLFTLKSGEIVNLSEIACVVRQHGLAEGLWVIHLKGGRAIPCDPDEYKSIDAFVWMRAQP